MNITTISQDLIDRLKTVTEYSGRVGMAVGAKDIDPINRDLPRPAAWAIYVGDDMDTENLLNPCASSLAMNFVVKILVDYDNDTGLIDTHLPLLHTTTVAIHGESPVAGAKWAYLGQGLEELTPDRMVWVQNYTIITSFG